MKIRVKKMKDNATLPQMMRKGDAAMDLYSAIDVDIEPMTVGTIETGIAMEIPEGYWGSVRGRGGLANKHSVNPLGGVIDSNYRGEINITLMNHGKEKYSVKAGDRVAQIIIQKHEVPELEEVDELSDSERGENRYASSGY